MALGQLMPILRQGGPVVGRTDSPGRRSGGRGSPELLARYPTHFEPEQVGECTRLQKRERHETVHHAVQVCGGHVQLSGQLGFLQPVCPAVRLELAREALLEPHGGSHPRLDAGADLGVVGVPRAWLDEQVARHVGG